MERKDEEEEGGEEEEEREEGEEEEEEEEGEEEEEEAVPKYCYISHRPFNQSNVARMPQAARIYAAAHPTNVHLFTHHS
jgi:hypothetical protein